MKKLIVAAVATGAVFALSSCTSITGSPENPDNWREVVVPVSDGRQVRCLIWDGYRKGGPSCDWANATKR
ncbi:hypothetical protein GCM10010149_88910 [Nonomuraea roseoviolacea subsp. roseoviolacea]|uniref:hypothetical protein n=1 Tax=Nonomuraea roseoviolacea TaxID=103837 RepID=UPI0031DF227A